jgi:hypothetical protein
LFFVLTISLGVYARYFLKFAGGYQTNNMSVLPLILMTIGLLLSVIITEVVLLKIGCLKSIRSGLWYGLSMGPMAGIWMFEKRGSLVEAIAIGAIIFVLAFTAIYLLDRRSSNKGRQ